MFKNCIWILAICLVGVSCKKDDPAPIQTSDIEGVNVYPAAPAKWFGGTSPYYSPKGFVGDVMPYFENDSFHVFYLHDARNGSGGFHPWNKFTTTDLAHYQYDGVMIPFGGSSDYDFALGTGSIIKSGNTYYAYYSGFNPAFNGSGGKYRDNILRATSTDLSHWTKDASFIIKPETTNGYNYWEFRDPYVFYNDETKEYWMLVSGRQYDKAAVMLYTSGNPGTGSWQLKDPVFTSTEYAVPETPQMFKWNNYWYLVFSDNSSENSTHYRIASSSKGPWQKPANDKFDGQYMYASKVASNANDHFVFGWCPTKSGSSETGNRDFGGNLVTHLLKQNSDGTLAMSMPEAVGKEFTKPVTIQPAVLEHSATVSGNSIIFPSKAGSAFVLFDKTDGDCMITATFRQTGASPVFGFALGLDRTVQNASWFKIEFDNVKKKLSGITVSGNNNRVEGSVDFEPGNGEHKVTLVCNGSVAILYVDDKLALTCRSYTRDHRPWGFYGENGLRVDDIKLFKP